jgi:hypothetical protein
MKPETKRRKRKSRAAAPIPFPRPVVVPRKTTVAPDGELNLRAGGLSTITVPGAAPRLPVAKRVDAFPNRVVAATVRSGDTEKSLDLRHFPEYGLERIPINAAPHRITLRYVWKQFCAACRLVHERYWWLP